MKDLILPNNIRIPAGTLEGFFWEGRENGLRWLETLPPLVESICQRHMIRDLSPSPELRLNLVLFGESATHGPVVIKLAPPNHEVSREIAALRVHGRNGGYVKILEADDAAGWMMLERVQPGEMLQTLAQSGEIGDEEATTITAQLMRASLEPLPADELHSFPDLTTWLTSLWKYADSGRKEIPAEQVELATRHARDLIANPEPPMLLHGDFHHGNILKCEKGWVIIDPKGIHAEKAFEVGPFFYNPIGVDKRPNLADIFDRRLDIFSQELGISRTRLWRCALVGCVLSDCWSLEDGFSDYTHFDTVTATLMQLPERDA